MLHFKTSQLADDSLLQLVFINILRQQTERNNSLFHVGPE